MLKVALASRQKSMSVSPPKSLNSWTQLGGWADSAGDWTAGDDGVLAGSGSRIMTFPQGVAHTDFYLKFEAMDAKLTHGGVVIRRRVRGYPGENGARHSGYYIQINSGSQNQTGQIGRWRNKSEIPMLAASAVQECSPQKWYAFEVVAVGGRIAVFVDGVFASFWSEPTADPLMLYKEGVPTFRVERGTVSFRNIEVKELDAAAVNALPPLKR